MSVTRGRFVVSTRGEKIECRSLNEGKSHAPEGSSVLFKRLPKSENLLNKLELFSRSAKSLMRRNEKWAHSKFFCQLMGRICEAGPSSSTALLACQWLNESAGFLSFRLRCFGRVQSLCLRQFHGDFWCWMFIFLPQCYSFLTEEDFLSPEMKTFFSYFDAAWMMFLYADLKNSFTETTAKVKSKNK